MAGCHQGTVRIKGVVTVQNGRATASEVYHSSESKKPDQVHMLDPQVFSFTSY